MYLVNFSHFRYHFWNPIRETLSVTFSNGTQLIVRAAGDWQALGYEVGMRMAVSGSASNDRMFTIAAFIGANTVVVNPATDVTVAEVATVTLETGHYDADGLERWPVDKLRLSGFGATGSTFIGVPRPALARNPFSVTCNGGDPDAVAGIDEYDWYLSQRSDDVAKQRLFVDGAVGFSGSITINPLPEDGAPISPEDLATYFKFCHLYVQRRSDKAIQWVDLYRYMTGKVSY